jgi:hypothetical protein
MGTLVPVHQYSPWLSGDSPADLQDPVEIWPCETERSDRDPVDSP